MQQCQRIQYVRRSKHVGAGPEGIRQRVVITVTVLRLKLISVR